MSAKNKKQAQISLKQQLIRFFTDYPYMDFNYKQVCGKLGIIDKSRRKSVMDQLELLAGEDFLVEFKRGTYRINPEMAGVAVAPPPVITGTVDMKQTGKAYIMSTETEEDVFITPNNVHHALHGDLVKVRLFPKRVGKKIEGEIVEIVERRKKQFVGVVSIGRQMSFLTPDDQRTPMDIFILHEDLMGAQNGMKAIAELTDWPEKSASPFGRIIHVLGKPGENDVEMNSILAQNDFPLAFSKEVERETDKFAETIPIDEIKNRRDFRNIFTITIDPEDAKDFDDALSLKVLSEDRFEIGIHIADVSFYVKPGTAIDKEAFDRATSVYLVDRVIPMLPEKLSNMLCSLRPGEDKLCFSAVFEMDKAGKVYAEWFGKTVIHSDIRFCYEQVQEIIEGKSHEKKDPIMTMHTIASSLRDTRFRKGAINFRSKEVRFILDENGKPLRVVLKEQKESNHLVEEFMLLANRKVAEWVNHVHAKKSASVPSFVYRIHDEPSPERLHTFSEFLMKLGYRIDTSVRKRLSDSLNTLLDQISGKAEENMIETIAVRTMAKAVYSANNIGHYGLGFPFYTHFTSPIRRYPDLMVHRFFCRYLDNLQAPMLFADLEEACKHCSDMEKKAADAERDSVKYKQAEYMVERIGETFGAVISGVSKWGIFAEIDEIKAEGLVRMKDIGNDFFYLDEENYSVIGHRTGQELRLGDRISVLVRAVDLPKKQLELGLVSHVPQGKPAVLMGVSKSKARPERKQNFKKHTGKKRR